MKKFLDDEAFHAELTNLFLSEGMRALTVGSIAARLRCSRRRLYELAQTKEELFCQVTQRHFDTALAAGDAVLEHAQGDLARVGRIGLRIVEAGDRREDDVEDALRVGRDPMIGAGDRHLS